MIYKTSNQYEAESCLARVQYLIGKGANVEVTDKRPRSLAQNAYAHSIIGVVAMDIGLSLEEAKRTIFKELVNPDIFVEERDIPHVGKIRLIKSSKTIPMEEMSKAIDRFKAWARGEGYIIPEPGDDQRLLDIEIEMSRHKYL